MMLSFKVNKSRQTFEKQWTFLFEKGQNKEQNTLNKFFIGLILITAFYVLIYLLTAVNYFIVFKGVSMVMIALAWCVLVLLYLVMAVRKAKGKRRLQNFLNSFSNAQLSYAVEIDEEKVVVVSKGLTQELRWTEFTSFGIHHETLYVFNGVTAMNSLYWDQSEMGSEAYLGLLEMLKKKAIKQMF